MVKTKKTILTVVLAVITLLCVACALTLGTTGKAKADGEKLIDVDATTVAGLSYGAVSVDATTGGKLGSGLLVSGTSGFINVPFSVADFKTLTVGADPYFASVLDYDYENEITPFFTLVIDSAFLDNGNGYNCIWFAVKTESGTISQFNLTIRKNGANVPPAFFNNYSWSLDDDNAEQYVIRAFVDYANGKFYYCTGLEIGAGTARNVADYCTVIDYDFEGSGLFNCSTGYLEFEIGNGMGGGSTVPVNVWVKDLCGERNFNAAIKYESALTGSYGGTLSVPNATISYLGVDYAAAKSVTAPDGNPAEIGSTIDQIGNYTVRYSINKGGKIYYKDAVLRIVEPVLIDIDDNTPVYEAISIDDTTGDKLGSAYNVSDGAYVFPFDMDTFKTLTVPTTRLKSLFNSEGRDPDMEDIVPLATIVCRGTGFNSSTTGIDIKIGTDLSNGDIDELNLRLRAAAGGTSVPGLLWDNNYPVDDEYGEQKAIRIYADYTNGKILVTCGLAIDNDDRMTNYLNNRINYDFAATGMFEGETGFITVQCFDYMTDGQAANCTAYVKNICGAEAGLVPTVSASAIGDCCPDGTAMDIPAGTVAFLGNNESADIALFNPAGNKIATDTAITEAGEYTVRYSLTFDSMQANYQLLKQNGFDYIFDQSQCDAMECTGFSRLKMYLNAKLAWDVNADADKLTKNFFDNYFLDASENMYALFNSMKDTYNSYYANGQITGNLNTTASMKKTGCVSRIKVLAWMNMLEDAYADVEKYKDTDAELYAALRDRITVESVCVRYLYSEVYPSYIEDLTKFRGDLKNDMTGLNFNRWMENYDINNLFNQWGV